MIQRSRQCDLSSHKMDVAGWLSVHFPSAVGPHLLSVLPCSLFRDRYPGSVCFRAGDKEGKMIQRFLIPDACVLVWGDQAEKVNR